MNPDPRLQTLSQYQTYCLIPIIVLNVLPHQHAIDAQHAQNSAIFRLIVTVLCVAGMIALEVKKHQIKKAALQEAARQPIPPAPGTWPPPPQGS